MNRSWWSKLILLVFFTGLSVIYVYPTIANIDLETTKFPFKKKITLGLDLQGGLYLVLGVNFDKVMKEVAERQSASARDSLKDAGFTVTGAKVVTEGFPADDPRILLQSDAAKQTELKEKLKRDFYSLRLTGEKPGELELGLSREYKAEVREHTINQSIEVIRNRIDEFGVAEPSITSQGADRIVVELPGVKDVSRAKDLIGRTARLEFRIVNVRDPSGASLPGELAELEKQGIVYKEGTIKISEYVAKVNAALKGKIPEDSEVLFERGDGNRSPIGTLSPYLVFKKINVTGDDLQDAQVGFDQETGRPEVAFTMNPRGGQLMGETTEAHKNEPLAIILDNIVVTAPNIQSKITDRGRITLGMADREKTMKEAKDIAIVLRAGALPAQLDFLEQRVVGPSLGQDSIKNGTRAGIVGCLLVFLFMIFYYRGSGMVATVSLLLNGLFVFAILVGMEATLTLPGIAGIALTIGMAVDANVIIFERIRDELSEGKSIPAAVEAGFQKAFSAIFDANITHGIIALILMNYGTGPIRGFAVTLLVGIITTLFCAVTVCKLIFEGYLAKRGDDLKALSI